MFHTKVTMKVLYQYIATLFILIPTFLTSCGDKPNGSWVLTTPAKAKIWLASIDTLSTYQWEGETFDSVASGKGILTVLRNDSIIDRRETIATFGAINDSDIVLVGSNEQYIGETVGELFEGYGVYLKGSDIYIGNFHKGQPSGYLTLYRNKKVYYSGFWEAGAFHGEGTLYKEDGTIKTGEWDNGRLSQKLVDSQLKKGRYKGYVRDGHPDGLGYMRYNNGDEYQGIWKQGKYHNIGLLCQGQDSILGHWEEGKLVGDALCRTSNFIYEGGFVDNIPTGVGILTSADGSFYSGSWMDGKRNGIGDMFFANGDTYSGDWENNEFHGVGKFTYTP